MFYINNSFFFKFLGDIEKKYRLGVSPLCDRQTESVANIQIGNYTHWDTGWSEKCPWF